MKFIAVFIFLKGFTAKQTKMPKKKNHNSLHNSLRDNCMENIIKFSFPKMTGQNDQQDECLTGQVHNEAGHCALTGYYFQPCISLGIWFLSRGTDITYYSDCKASYHLNLTRYLFI